jgi:hypothetical protein
MTVKLCCSVQPLLVCHLCNTRQCKDCWLSDTSHYNALFKYSCPLYPDEDIAVIQEDGIDLFTSNAPTMGPYHIIPWREGYVRSPLRRP